MKNGLTVLFVFALSLIFLSASGCSLGLFAASGKQKSFAGNDAMEFKSERSKTEILNIIIETGKESGYDISMLDREKGIVQFRNSNSPLEGMFIMKNFMVNLTCILKPAVIEMQILVTGNWGKGEQENAEKLLSIFKDKLAKKLA